MKVVVYSPTEAEETIIRLKLIEMRDGCLLHVVDAQGRATCQGRIAIIKADGILQICTSLNPNIGLSIDADSRHHKGIQVNF